MDDEDLPCNVDTTNTDEPAKQTIVTQVTQSIKIAHNLHMFHPVENILLSSHQRVMALTPAIAHNELHIERL